MTPVEDQLDPEDPSYELPTYETALERHNVRNLKNWSFTVTPWSELSDYQRATSNVSAGIERNRWSRKNYYPHDDETDVAVTLVRAERLKKINDSEKQLLRDMAHQDKPLSDGAFAAIVRSNENVELADRPDLNSERVKDLLSFDSKNQAAVITRLEENDSLDDDCRQQVTEARRYTQELSDDQEFISRCYAQLPDSYSSKDDCRLAVNPNVHPKMLVALIKRREQAWAKRSEIAAAVARNPQSRTNYKLRQILEREAENRNYKVKQRQLIVDALDENPFEG